jgi:hypothetical protein
MTVHQIRPESVQIQCKSVAADKIDKVVAEGVLCSSIQYNLAASYFLETGRIEEAKLLNDAAELGNRVYRTILPPAPLRSAPEAWEGRP